MNATLPLYEADPVNRAALRHDLALSMDFRRRFRLGALLGAGGSSTVYQAHDLRHDRPVAIKILTKLTSRLERRRFQREGEFLRRVDHVNVVSLHETGVESGHPYIVMDFAAGGTLRGLLRAHGRLPLTQAVDIALDLLAGLSAMHAQGLVHRDLKPDNVLLDHAGRARIGDLGVAYDMVAGDADSGQDALVGTPRYMAPEQARSHLVDATADVYAVGLILFEMLAGQAPFMSRTADELLEQHLHQCAPDIAARVPWVPAALSALIAAALAKSASARPPTAEAFRQALAACRPTTSPAIARPAYRLAIDREVLVRARSSHRSAVELLYHEYASLVRAYLLRATGPMGLRSRTHEVFHIAGRSIPAADAPVSFAHWLLRIAAHVAEVAAA